MLEKKELNSTIPRATGKMMHTKAGCRLSHLKEIGSSVPPKTWHTGELRVTYISCINCLYPKWIVIACKIVDYVVHHMPLQSVHSLELSVVETWQGAGAKPIIHHSIVCPCSITWHEAQSHLHHHHMHAWMAHKKWPNFVLFANYKNYMKYIQN